MTLEDSGPDSDPGLGRGLGRQLTTHGVMEYETARTRCCRPALITISLYAGPTRSSANSYGAGGAGPRKRILRAT